MYTSNRLPQLAVVTVFTVIIIAMLVLASLADAAVYYVATNGNDNNSGAQVAPFATVQRAIDQRLKPGDTVLIRAGRYAGFSVDYPLDGTPAQPITIKSYSGETAIIDRALMAANVHAISLNWGGRYLIVDGLEITDSSTAKPADICLTTNAIKFYCPTVGPEGCIDFAGPYTFQNLHIHENRGTAIIGHGNDVSIINNNIHHNGRYADGRTMGVEAYATYIQGNRAIIRGNLVHHNSGAGIRAGNVTYVNYYLSDSVIEDNVIYDNHLLYGCHQNTYWDDFGGLGIIVYGGQRNVVRNNIVYGDHTDSLKIDGLNNLIYNNTFTGSSSGVSSYWGPNTFVNNIVYGNGERLNLTGDGDAQHHNLLQDPRWVNPVGGDFHLQNTSPAIDAGVTLATVQYDLDKVPRPQGGSYDIGAYEWQGKDAQAPRAPTNVRVQ